MKSNFSSTLVKKYFIPAVVILSLLPLLIQVVQGQTLRTVAISGDGAPGTSVSFSVSLGRPSLNDFGQTAFHASLTGVGVTSLNADGVWSEGGDAGLLLVAREGDPEPGIGDTNSILISPVLNNAGQVAFTTSSGVSGFDSDGIWSEGGSAGLALIARRGDAAPGTSGDNFTSFSNLALNDAGETAFIGGVFGNGIWSEDGGAGLALVAGTGDAAPGTGGAFFTGFSGLDFNNTGPAAFHGKLGGTGVSGSNRRGIWSEGGGAGLDLVARTGNTAPSTGGAIFSGFALPALNDAGQTAFFGTISGIGVDGSNNGVIWSEGGGSGLTLVARTGSSAPNTSSGVMFSNIGATVLNNAGQTAFRGNLVGTGVNLSNDSGIWSEGGGAGLALVAREGDAAPGTEGANFSSFSGVNPFFNDAGQAAFSGSVTGAGVDNDNGSGIWAEDTSGVLTLIARAGDLLDVDDGPGIDLRTISSLSFGDFNNSGQLAFRANFADGSSGLFVSNLATVPEPCTAMLMIPAFLSLCLRRTRFKHPRGLNGDC